MKTTDLNDYELIYLFHEGSQNAYDLIINKYKKLIYKKCLAFNILKHDVQDYVQEGLIVLDKAIKIYNENRGKTFTRFFELLLIRRFVRIKEDNKDRFLQFDDDLVNKIADEDYKKCVFYYSKHLSKKIYQDIFVELYYYKTSVKDISEKYNISEFSVYRYIKCIREEIAFLFDL